ncbi:MAG: hypothetical protein QNJ65_00120 [Xenococcaceae cyanobacterium MO_234.B1]|nr:hypothetical protein [Xenococcaceae cyanobacterium MO_234.B1]
MVKVDVEIGKIGKMGKIGEQFQYCSETRLLEREWRIGGLGDWGIGSRGVGENNYLPTSLSPYIPIPPPINKRCLSEQYCAPSRLSEFRIPNSRC